MKPVDRTIQDNQYIISVRIAIHTFEVKVVLTVFKLACISASVSLSSLLVEFRSAVSTSTSEAI